MKDTILIVDDEKVLVLMDKMLSKKYKTLIAKNGQEGLDIFKENKEDIKLIVTDEMMPKMSGSRMMAEISKLKPNMPVIFVTGKDSVPYEGGHHLIKKPFNIIDLFGMVKTLMGSYKSGSGEHNGV